MRTIVIQRRLPVNDTSLPDETKRIAGPQDLHTCVPVGLLGILPLWAAGTIPSFGLAGLTRLGK